MTLEAIEELIVRFGAARFDDGQIGDGKHSRSDKVHRQLLAALHAWGDSLAAICEADRRDRDSARLRNADLEANAIRSAAYQRQLVMERDLARANLGRVRTWAAVAESEEDDWHRGYEAARRWVAEVGLS